MNLYFTCESSDTHKSFALFIPVKVVAKLNLGHRNNFEELAVVVHVRQITQSLVISRCCFAEDGKEMYTDL